MCLEEEAPYFHVRDAAVHHEASPTIPIFVGSVFWGKASMVPPGRNDHSNSRLWKSPFGVDGPTSLLDKDHFLITNHIVLSVRDTVSIKQNVAWQDAVHSSPLLEHTSNHRAQAINHLLALVLDGKNRVIACELLVAHDHSSNTGVLDLSTVSRGVGNISAENHGVAVFDKVECRRDDLVPAFEL